MIAKRIIFIGRVQGVGFRFTAYGIANRHGLAGFVRNRLDGSVEMLAQGGSDDVLRCVRDVERSFAGYIRETRIEETTFDSKYTDFRITF